MYGESSEFGPIDLIGSLVVNIGGTHMACKSADLRVGIKDGKGEIKPYADFRFLGGAVAALASQWVENPSIRRAAHDAANGLLNSFVATETARMAAITKLGCAVDPATGTPTADAAEAPPVAEKAKGEMNYSYGW